MLGTLRGGVALLLVLLLPALAVAQPGGSPPILRIEAGGHVGRANDAAMDAAGRVLVTASEDKTARIWSLPALRPMGVLRPPIGPDAVGEVHAVAVSPDGRLAALGGWTRSNAHDVLLFDLQTQRVVRRLPGLPSVVFALAFDREGGRLAAGLGGANGIRVWRITDGAMLLEDRAYRDHTYGLAFGPDGRLAAASYDGGVRLYDRAGQMLARAETVAARRPFRIRFSPDGRLLALGFGDAVALEVRDGPSLALRHRPDVSRLDGRSLTRVTWSADGATLYAGEASLGAGLRSVYAWAAQGAGARSRAAAGFGDGPAAILPLAGGRLAFASLSGEIALVGRDGARLWEQRRPYGDLKTAPGDTNHASRRFRLGRDGTLVEFALFDAPRRWLRFDARRADLAVGGDPQRGLSDWTDGAGNLRATGWDDGTDPKLGGRTLTLARDERTRSVAVVPGRALLGTYWSLRLFDAQARQLWRRTAPGTTWRVNLSPDGRLAVAAHGDGTIRWYRATDGHPLLTLFLTADAERWVAYTPGGYYAASPGGEELIGWHVNNGPEQAADFFSASRFRDRFYRPDVMTRILDTLDEAEALRQADGARPVPAPAPAVVQDLPPVVAILSPTQEARLTGPEATIAFTLRSPSGRSVRGVQVQLNGRPAEGVRDLRLPDLRGAEEGRGQVTLPIPPGQAADIALLAETATRVGDPARLRLHGAPIPAPEPPRPRLNAVLIGITDYADPTLRPGVRFAAKDARDLERALRAQAGRGLFRAVETRLVLNADATRDNIADALEWLYRAGTATDIAIVLFAGHAVLAENQPYFVPVNVAPDNIVGRAMPDVEIKRLLSRIPGRVVAFFDVCHAAAFFEGRGIARPDMTAFLNELREPRRGIVPFVATSARQIARERPGLNNGAFTHALLDGLDGGADRDGNGLVTVEELRHYVIDRVKALTGGLQHPNAMRPSDIPDFALFSRGRN
jgi:WD40 repeat protein